MDKTQYNQLKSQIENKYREEIAKAEAERVANLAALDRVWELIQEIQHTEAVYDCKGCGNTTEHLPQTCEKCSWGSFERRKKRIFKLTG